jgi:hypothetical protein
MLALNNLRLTAQLTTRRALLSAALAACALPLSAFRPAGEIGREMGGGSDLRSAYFAEFTGVGADGRDMVWRGAAAGAAVGELTVRLAHAGRAVDTAKPKWPVEGIIFVSGEDPRRAFAAEVHGTIDWTSKRLKLEGEVSVGYMKGAHLEQTADLINFDLSGEMRFTPAALAAR